MLMLRLLLEYYVYAYYMLPCDVAQGSQRTSILSIIGAELSYLFFGRGDKPCMLGDGVSKLPDDSRNHHGPINRIMLIMRFRVDSPILFRIPQIERGHVETMRLNPQQQRLDTEPILLQGPTK